MESKQERIKSVQELDQTLKTRRLILKDKILKKTVEGTVLTDDKALKWKLHAGDTVNVYDAGESYLICKRDQYIPWKPRTSYWFVAYMSKIT